MYLVNYSPTPTQLFFNSDQYLNFITEPYVEPSCIQSYKIKPADFSNKNS